MHVTQLNELKKTFIITSTIKAYLENTNQTVQCVNQDWVKPDDVPLM